jgi:hypothetical protein
MYNLLYTSQAKDWISTPRIQGQGNQQHADVAERVGISKAVCYSARAFNKMPETVVLTGSYVLSHLEQQSQRKH